MLYRQGFFTEKTVSFTYPTTYLVDKGGMIVAVRVGFLHWDTPEARALITALKEDEIHGSAEPGPGDEGAGQVSFHPYPWSRPRATAIPWTF